MYNRGQRIRPRERTESRHHQSSGRQLSWLRQGKQVGHHRGLRAGHVRKRVIRELGRASRLLGSNSRKAGDRQNQHPGIWWSTRLAGEPNSAEAGRDTKNGASTQGTGREREANRPGWTEAVVATHSTAGRGVSPARRRGEPRPKGPTITTEGTREGNAGHGVGAKETREGH